MDNSPSPPSNDHPNTGNKAAPQKQSEPKCDAKTARRRRMRLLLLHHASKCKNAQCTAYPQKCAEAKVLWKHLRTCKDKNCNYPHCFSSRCLLGHYRRCKPPCSILCKPVAEICAIKDKDQCIIMEQKLRQEARVEEKREREKDVQEFRTAFGREHPYYPDDIRRDIRKIKNKDPNFRRFRLSDFHLRHSVTFGMFGDFAWELLGKYIANNPHLEEVDLSVESSLTDDNMMILFQNLPMSKALTGMSIGGEANIERGNSYGYEGIRSMVPFLKSSPNLTKLQINNSQHINTNCFRLIVEALQGGPIKRLCFSGCGIEDIGVLETSMLPNLQHLNLIGNRVGNTVMHIPSLETYRKLESLELTFNDIRQEGCVGIAKLLSNTSSSLERLCLHLSSNGAEIIFDSLKHNAVLTELSVGGYCSYLENEGGMALLRTLNDVSSIEATYNSNHTLRKFDGFPHTWRSERVMLTNISSALWANRNHEGNPHAAGRAKIIMTQLDSKKRKELCSQQGIEFSFNSIFECIDPMLLPDILALVHSNEVEW
eukprot:CAMPEP_0183732646 /NCGR_PEP_ID=MMETSP0737-20130205/38988_1 /TAXON_ID=385413 /ORGANISM="Thalassiosira miniscula, Strain CCMP1093" /LENGTH=540 /DNA_ID=CAMNT_0025965717 /DNA_START=213 /DNA_END=1832 /DNA_ORIENTATION=+